MRKNFLFFSFLLIGLLSFSHSQGQPYVLENSSSVAGYYNWGADWWTPYQWYRYAECWVSLDFTRSLAHPTYLNIIAECSQRGLTSTIDVYISTTSMLFNNIPEDSWVYTDGNWCNWHTKTGGYYVGRYVTPPGHERGLVSWNIDSWIRANPSDRYFICIDQLGVNYDVQVFQLWLGPQGRIQDISENNTPFYPTLNRKAQNIPNPFASSTTIKYYLSTEGNVSIVIYDKNGNKVKTLLDNVFQKAGTHTISWNGVDELGKKVSPGTYFYKIELPQQIIQGKMVIQK